MKKSIDTLTPYEKVTKVGGWAINKPSGVAGAAKHFEVSVKAVRQFALTYQRCSDDVLQALRSRTIGARHAYELSKLSHDQQILYLRSATSLSVKQLQVKIKESTPDNLIIEPKGVPLDDPNIKAVTEQIEENWGVAIEMFWVDRKTKLMLKVVAVGFPTATKFMNRFGVQILDAPIDISASHFKPDMGHLVRMHFKFQDQKHFTNHLFKVVDRLVS